MSANFCDVCSAEGPLTWRTNERGMVERLCSPCWRWADYWESLSAGERDDLYLFHGDG